MKTMSHHWISYGQRTIYDESVVVKGQRGSGVGSGRICWGNDLLHSWLELGDIRGMSGCILQFDMNRVIKVKVLSSG